MTRIAFDYNSVPTLARFSNSDAFIRAAIGPVGCLPADTEFMSPTGWKRMDAFVPGDMVAQWHPDGSAYFVVPTRYIEAPSPDGFLQFESGFLTMRLSPDHRVPHFNWDGQFQVRTAAEIARKISRRKVPTTFDLKRTSRLDMSDCLIRFAVMMHADGHYPKDGKKAVITVRKERKKIRIRYLLASLNVEFTERTYPKRPTETRFSFVPPYRGKRFDMKWWSADSQQLAIIIDEFQYWDGLFGYDEQRYFSAFKEDADFIQYAAHALGRRASLATIEYPDKPSWKPCYLVALKADGSLKNTATLRAETVITKLPSPDGKQYCFEVPSGFFIVRCDDTIFITGNSGKSSACVVEVPYRAQMQAPGPDGIRRTRWLVVRNSYRELSDTTIRTFHQWLPPQYFGRWHETDKRFTIKSFAQTEIEILFRALDTPEDIKKVLSLDLTGAWVNEYRQIPWSLIEAIQGRCGRYPSAADGGPTWSGMWMDTNPPDIDHPSYKFFEERSWLKDFEKMVREGALPKSIRKPDDYAQIFHQPSGLSPQAENLPNLPQGYYQRLAIGKSDEWIKVYIHGDYGFVSEDKTVFPEYRDEIHLKAIDPVPGTIERNWDFGLCYDDQTEVLTLDGWKLFVDVDCDCDLIASRDPLTGAMEYNRAAFKIAKPYNGDMLEWSSTELNLCITPEHRVPFTFRDSPNKVHWQSAEWLAQHMSGHHYVDLLSEWAGVAPDRILGMEPMVYAEFMGLFLSEGTAANRHVSIYQKHRHADMQRILDATGLNWHWRGNGQAAGWHLYNAEWSRKLQPLGTAKTKRVPLAIRTLPPRHIRAFIMAYTAGDGHIRRRKNGAVEHTLYTTSIHMSADMQDLAQKAGWNSSAHWQKPQTSNMGGRLITNSGGWRVTFKKTASRAELLKRNFRRVAYDGMVYCLNVPHHTLYVRRGGKPSWNGNTPACTLSQMQPDGRWLVFDEIIAVGMGADRFSDQVLEHCGRTFRGKVEFDDLGDPAGDSRSQTDERTCFEILQNKGINIYGGEQNIALRLESVRKPLRTLVNGLPRFVLHPRCRNVRKAFLGAYYFRRMATNSERYSNEPEKNHPYSDLMDGIEYRAVKNFGGGLIGDAAPDDYPQAPRSMAGRSTVTGY